MPLIHLYIGNFKHGSKLVFGATDRLSALPSVFQPQTEAQKAEICIFPISSSNALGKCRGLLRHTPNRSEAVFAIFNPTHDPTVYLIRKHTTRSSRIVHSILKVWFLVVFGCTLGQPPRGMMECREIRRGIQVSQPIETICGFDCFAVLCGTQSSVQRN